MKDQTNARFSNLTPFLKDPYAKFALLLFLRFQPDQSLSLPRHLNFPCAAALASGAVRYTWHIIPNDLHGQHRTEPSLPLRNAV